MFGVLVEWVRDFGLAGDYPCYFAHFSVSRFCAKRLMLLIFHAFWGWFSAGLVSRTPFFVTFVHMRNIYHKTTEESTVNTYLERQSAPLATLPRSGDWWCPLGDNVNFGSYYVCHNHNLLHVLLFPWRCKHTYYHPRVGHLAMRLASVRHAIISPSTFRTNVRNRFVEENGSRSVVSWFSVKDTSTVPNLISVLRLSFHSFQVAFVVVRLSSNVRCTGLPGTARYITSCTGFSDCWSCVPDALLRHLPPCVVVGCFWSSTLILFSTYSCIGGRHLYHRTTDGRRG